MEIEKNIDGKKLDVKLIGKLDINSAPTVDESLKEDLDNIEDLTLDLGDVTYISSAGLRVILSVQKIMNKQGSMKLINVQDDIIDIFKATGFIDILTIE